MTSAELLTDAFERIRAAVHGAVQGLSPDRLTVRLDDQANSIAWLVWHLTRIQDDHIADVAGVEQAWTSGGFAERFALPFDTAATGYGHTAADVAAVTVDSAQLLSDYHDAVHEQTVRFVGRITDADLDRIVDEAWDPPVSLGVRLVSVVNDNTQHAGQAAFVRGVVLRR
jgi:uncharacterized damage-inducible protein DinB